MVAASYFARAAAWLTPLTLSFRTLSATPLESPDPERARTYLTVREACLQCSPVCTRLPLMRTLSVTFRTFRLHAYPSNAPSHSPHRTRQSPCTIAHGLRAMHTSHLLLSTTLKRPCSLPPPLRPPRLREPCSAHGSGHVSQQNRTCYRRVAMESKKGADRTSNPCVNHTLVSQGWTAVECTPRTSASADPPLTATRGGSGPITSLPRYRQEATLRPFVTRTMLHLNHGAMLHLNHGGGRATAVYCDNMERIARRQGATREEELGTVARRPLRAPKYRPTARSDP